MKRKVDVECFVLSFDHLYCLLLCLVADEDSSIDNVIGKGADASIVPAFIHSYEVDLWAAILIFSDAVF